MAIQMQSFRGGLNCVPKPEPFLLLPLSDGAAVKVLQGLRRGMLRHWRRRRRPLPLWTRRTHPVHPGHRRFHQHPELFETVR